MDRLCPTRPGKPLRYCTFAAEVLRLLDGDGDADFRRRRLPIVRQWWPKTWAASSSWGLA